ncbi:MAG: alcohol dehydrogenase catalytic domain-containing protein [Oscillospiraceae bacterium]|jgi:ribitol-5-phosphate 2-dehydrogenase|nr:alcohol dehydrogenase catalytic domain-containing protein [Oscillospiraceae bacterium]
MIDVIYRLTAPGRFEIAYEELPLCEDQVLLRPRWLSICKADQRYYQGNRSPEALKAKLPMALVHECAAEVVRDPTGRFARGALVAICPNLPVQTDEFIAENYLFSSRFRSSGADGFLQEYVLSAPDRLIPVPQNTSPEICAFLELISVAMHSISRFERFSHRRRERLAVWGDGSLGYITALLLRTLYPQARLTVLGTVEEKLSYFSFAEERLDVRRVRLVEKESLCDHAFECVGGAGCRNAINQMIEAVAPEGTLALLGVSENFVDINTRMVLEKGLRLFGSSRSGVADFARAAAVLEQNPILGQYLERLVSRVLPVRSIEDLHHAFLLDGQQSFGKTILRWEM